MTKFRLIIATILALLVTVMILQNTETVETKFLFLTVYLPHAVLLLATLFIGFALGVIATLFYGKQRRKKPLKPHV